MSNGVVEIENGNGPVAAKPERFFRISQSGALVLLAALAGGNLLKSFDLASGRDVEALKSQVGTIGVEVKELASSLVDGNWRMADMEDEIADLREEIEALKRSVGAK